MLGALLISPPLLAIFRLNKLIAGVPVLFVYLFVAWAVVILLMALVIERGRRDDGADNPPPPED